MISFPSILAQVAPTTASTSQPATPAPQWFDFLRGPIPLIVLFLLLYMFLFRGKKGTEKKREDMLSQLKKGDRIQTIGGILGTVVSVDDSQVLVKVDETSNTKLTFSRNAIHRVVEQEKAENK